MISDPQTRGTSSSSSKGRKKRYNGIKMEFSFDMGMGVSREEMLIVSAFNGEYVVSLGC